MGKQEQSKSEMTGADPWGRGHWLDRAPHMLRTSEGPDGQPLATSLDRRWLWRLEQFLFINATTADHRQMQADLSQYLHETCEHVWIELGDLTPTPSVQCLWCNVVRPSAEVAK